MSNLGQSSVSVVVPVFNAQRFLGECLASILGQDPAPLEVIVVDDGSTDDSAAIAEACGPMVRVVRRPNGGPSAARNAGVDAARGDFIAFLDSDDLWLPGKLRRQLDFFQSFPDTDICATWAQNFWMPEHAAEEKRFCGHAMALPYGGYTVQAAMVRRNVFERFARWDESLRHGECMVWFESCVQAGAVFREIPEVFTRRRLHADNMTRLETERARDGMFAFLKMRVDARRRTQFVTSRLLALLAPALPSAERTDYLRALLLSGAAASDAWDRWRSRNPSLVDALKGEPDDTLAATLPLLDAALTRESFSLSTEERARVRAAHLREELRANAYAGVFHRALAAAQTAEEDVLVLAGRPLGELLHGDASLHHSGAIDSLVRQRRRGDVVAALTAAGFLDDGRIGNAPWTRSRLRDPSGLPITVAETVLAHPWYRLREAEVWDRSGQLPAAGAAVRVPALHHQLVVLALRALWGGPSRTLLPLIDSTLLLRRESELDWAALVEDAERGRFALPLLAWLVFVRDALAASLPADVEAKLSKAAGRAGKLERELALAVAAAACGYRPRAVVSAAAAAGSPTLAGRIAILPSHQTLEWESGTVQEAGLAASRARRLVRFLLKR